MASSRVGSDEDEDLSPPPPRKRTSANSTPRRGSTVKRPPNGTTPKTPNTPTTPAKKTMAQNKTRTPASAPVRAKTGKKNEPTLLGDFLLGRPSPSRTRRKSLDVVKAEMSAEMVSKVQAPGGVQDRVKKWQKASAANVIIDPLADAASQPDDAGGWENEDDESVDEEERLRIKFREGKRPNGRRKAKEIPKETPKEPEPVKHPPNSAPKKRVISDSHWMKSKEKSPTRVGNMIPKDFLQTTAVNPPLEKKISDWVKRTESDESEKEKPRSKPRKKASKRELFENGSRATSSRTTTPDDGIRIRPSPANSYDDGIRVKPGNDSSHDDGIRVTPSKQRPKSEATSKSAQNDDGIRIISSRPQSKSGKSDKSRDDGIRITPSRPQSKSGKSVNSGDDGIRINPLRNLNDDEIRIKSSREPSVDDGIRVKPVENKRSKKVKSLGSADEIQTSKKKTEKHLKIPSEGSRHQESSTSERHQEDDDQLSSITPSPPENSKRRKAKEQTPPESLADIPFGNSAFSVLELPLGAEAGNIKRPVPPKRNGSFAVPKVLKKVFNEGMKIAHDTVEPPRGGQNKPPSIESWLKNTTDPFVEQSSPPPSMLDVSGSSCSRKPSYKRNDEDEMELTADHNSERSENRQRRHTHSAHGSEKPQIVEKEPALEIDKTHDNLPSISSPPMSPNGLKRSSATRNASSPKAAKKVPLKDAFMDAFRGESSTSRVRTASNPFIDITGLRERDVNTSPRSQERRIGRDSSDVSEDTPRKRRPRSEEGKFEEPPSEKVLPAFVRRFAPTTGARLSTIPSVETFNRSSSATGTESGLSQTTVTQDTVLTGTTSSSLSRHTRKSQRSKGSGLKRRLTKHSDLVSVLSLPDVIQPGGGKSIKSARSIRTTRNHLDTATLKDLMRELAEDEVKYMRELKTLVDGVIPVLLTCVLSKSDSAIAAGLFDPNHDPSQDDPIAKPIVDMGIALERLKNSHKRIPLVDPDAFISWALTAHRTYHDYLTAWRAGFQEVVVNLAPASSLYDDERSDIESIARDHNGDAIDANGERADVAYFLKRPLVRVKFLARTTKGLLRLMGSEKSKQLDDKFQDLSEFARRRYREENARIEDQAANNTDPTRARDPRSLELVEGIRIDRTRQVCARDIFYLDFEHSTGQRIDCRVELVLRDKPNDEGDLLICEMHDLKKSLLFPPISKDMVSARTTTTVGEVVVMIRGFQGQNEWVEVMLLEAGDPEAAAEWVQMLGTSPIPPSLDEESDNTARLDSLVLAASLSTAGKNVDYYMSGGLGADHAQIPTRERIRREVKERASSPKQDKRAPQRRAPSFEALSEVTEETLVSEPVKDLNDAMNRAGSLSITPKRPMAAKYYGILSSPRPKTPQGDVSSGWGSGQTTPTQSQEDFKNGKKLDRPPSIDLPYIPKVRSPSTPPTPEAAEGRTWSSEHLRGDEESKTPSLPTTPIRDDGAPPPPAHRPPPIPTALKNVPVLDTTTPRTTNRRTSSPLKHEYQPSDASGTSSAEESESDTSDSYSESSDEELESVDLPERVPIVPIYGERELPSESVYSLPNTTLAPSNSASQGPYRKAPVYFLPDDMERHTVLSISYWNEKGKWIDIYPKPCSMIVGPGWLRCYKADEPFDHLGSNPDEADVPQSLLAQELTPNVSMQRHTVDIHIRSPPMAESILNCKGTTVRYHLLTPINCIRLYQALYESSKNNMTYNRLEEERRVNAYGTHAYEGAGKPHRASWFGRKNSYRASARAPSEMNSEQTAKWASSRLSGLRSRLSGGGIFNIAKSSLDVSQGGNRSGSTSIGSSEYSGITPPRTPTSLFSGITMSQTADLGSENIKIRLYELVTQSRWEDHRYMFLTVTPPPPGRRQVSTLQHGIEKHIIVTRREHSHPEGPGSAMIDEVLGANCFQMVGVKGVMVTIWEDIRGPNGEIGQIGARGGVSGRQRKFLFQSNYVAHANWIFGLVASGGYVR